MNNYDLTICIPKQKTATAMTATVHCIVTYYHTLIVVVIDVFRHHNPRVKLYGNLQAFLHFDAVN